ncbi:MAG: virulence RhuM family protein [Syntrophaceae bacterium]|nr:virulence RhuM family protein [Syntrophaceae bacterium]
MSDHPVEANSSILIYQSEDGQTRIDVRLAEKTVWLSQAALAELYQTSRQNITVHIRNLYSERELTETATCKDYLQVQNEGSRKISRKIKLYNLDMIIAIGYRVRSHRGTQFRRWATERLREYLVKGFTMDDIRLKEGRTLGADYFDELLERIRDIRTSEKMFYRKITDIYRLSIDYDPQAEITHEFFATIQNKLHYAAHGHTAAELISTRANAEKPNMGLTSWKGAKVRQTDVVVAKNYLTEKEIKDLNRIVTMYLDYAEDQAQRQNPMYMKDWKDKLDAFLRFNKREVLKDPGSISAEIAQQLALKEYKKLSTKRLAEEADESDEEFECFVKQLKTNK